jgi:hypothetical protein
MLVRLLRVKGGRVKEHVALAISHKGLAAAAHIHVIDDEAEVFQGDDGAEDADHFAVVIADRRVDPQSGKPGTDGSTNLPGLLSKSTGCLKRLTFRDALCIARVG